MAQSPNESSSPKAAQELQAYFDSLAAEGRFSGAILVAKDGKTIASKAAGVADRKSGKPNTLETRFNLGSMNKMFTAVAIAQLAQKGKLKFDDTISKVWPDYPNKEVAEKVTIHQLLTHTSGMGMYTNEKFAAQRSRLLNVSAHLPLIVNEPLAFTPGEKFQYSNSGYMLLGAIIEKVSGKDYYDYVCENIFQPAGMNATGFYEPGKVTPEVAIGYTRMDANGARGKSRVRTPSGGRSVADRPAAGFPRWAI